MGPILTRDLRRRARQNHTFLAHPAARIAQPLGRQEHVKSQAVVAALDGERTKNRLYAPRSDAESERKNQFSARFLPEKANGLQSLPFRAALKSSVLQGQLTGKDVA